MRFKTKMGASARAILTCLVLFIGFCALSARTADADKGSGSGSPTPSPTPGVTPSPTPGVTPTPGATPSPTPGVTPTPGATPSPTPGVTPTPGATPSPTPGVTPSPSPSPTPGGGTRLRIRGTLTGAPFNGMVPSAEVELEQREDGSRRLKVEVERVNLPSGSVLGVLVDNVRVGNIILDRLEGELELRTDRGQAIPEVNTRTRVVIVDASGATVLGGAFSNDGTVPAPQPGFEIRIEARLAGAPINGLTPRGHAKFRVREDGRRKLNVEVEKVNLPVGTVLNVLVDGAKVGEIALGPALENELELDTNNNQFVPQVTSNTRVAVTNQQGATIVSGTFNTTVAPILGRDIDDSRFFVEQQYRDFFDREADDAGLSFWKGQIESCAGEDRPCVERVRVNTSGAFFLSIEFQSTGYLLYRLNVASFGERPRRTDFLVDMQRVSAGVVVGRTGWEQQLEANKQALVADWVSRAAFRQTLGALSNEQFVDALNRNAGGSLTQAERDALVAGLNGGSETRATVLRKVAENAAFSRRQKNAAFVQMQYFGYLHRDPDDAGFRFWLNKLDQFGGDFHAAEMVKAFIVAGEYRGRFDW